MTWREFKEIVECALMDRGMDDAEIVSIDIPEGGLFDVEVDEMEGTLRVY